MKMIVPSETLVQKRYSMEDWLVLELLPNMPNLMQRCRKSSGRFLTLHKRRRKKLTTRKLLKNYALLDDLSHGLVKQVLNDCHEWNFNAFLLENVSGGRSLTTLSLHLFHWYGLINYFKLDTVRVWKLFSLIEEGYHSTNPYHNAIHATDVMQAMHCFIQETKIKEHLTPLEILTALLSAVAHDLDHPGVNQPFLIATSNHLAALYGNMSVLENHHWRSALCCLIDSGISEQLKFFKQDIDDQMKSLILATDIDRHQEFLLKFQKYLDEDSLNLARFEDRHFILQIALKCADISNPTRPWDISRKWSIKVCEEFFRQGDYERKLNLPITALCDRFSTSIPKIQSRFLRFIGIPLFSEWHKFLKSDLSERMIEFLNQNQHNWEYMEQLEQTNKTDSVVSIDDNNKDNSANDKSDSESDKVLFNDFMQRVQVPSSCNLRRHSVPANLMSRKGLPYIGRTNLSLCDESLMKFSLKFGSDTSIFLPTSTDETNAEKPLSVENLVPEYTILSMRRNSDIITSHGLEETSDLANSKFLKRQQTCPSIVPTTNNASTPNEPHDFDYGCTDTIAPTAAYRKTSVAFNVPTIMISGSGSGSTIEGSSGHLKQSSININNQKENLDPQKDCYQRRGSAPVMILKADENLIENRDDLLPHSSSHHHISTSFRRGSMPIDIYHYHNRQSGEDTETEEPEKMIETDTFIVQMPVSSWKLLRRDSAPPSLPDRLLTRHLGSFHGKTGRRFKHLLRRGSAGTELCASDSCTQSVASGSLKRDCLRQKEFDGTKRRGSLPLEVFTN